jgi:glycosyltransferase involved in cell wall biosynthesis
MNGSDWSRNPVTGSSEEVLIEVLLATYNGERFLAEQLDSLFSQTWHNIRVLVRDDCSSDRTLNTLEDYASRYPGRLLVEQNRQRIGPCGNFGALMQCSNAAYISFCDQDDIWRSDKLARSMAAMSRVEAQSGKSTQILIYTDMRIASSDGAILSESHWQRAGVLPEVASFQNLLAQNLVTGCTMVANRALVDLASPIPLGDVIMHDYWLALVASAFGVLKPIREQTVTYRQHSNNVVGAGKKMSWVHRLRRLHRDPELEKWLIAADTQAAAFLERYGHRLPKDVLSALSSMIGFPERSWLGRNLTLLRHGIRRTGNLNHLQFILRL